MPDPINWALTWPYLATALAVGYGLGAIPFGLILTRLAGMGDIRAIGSGNIGATNVLRTGNKGLAAATLALDALKGTAAVWLGSLFGPDLAVTAGFGAFLGHLFPVWLKFRGGKGVATFLGVLLGLYWPAFVGFALVWLAVAVTFRYSSLAALVAASLVPIALLALGHNGFSRAYLASFDAILPLPGGSLWQMGVVSLVMAVMLIAKHHENIRRLLAGTESRIGAKGTSPTANRG